MKMPKNRWLAFASHFGISLVIFVVILLFIVFFWYPGALFGVAGGWQGIRIVIGIDLVLGPLLTLMVYDLAKPRKVLLRDLLVICLIQFSCLSGGVYIVFNERPLAVTYAYDKFYVYKHSDFIKSGIDHDTLGLNLMTPKIFYVDLNKLAKKSGIEPKAIVKLYGMTGKNLADKSDLYTPFPVTSKEAEIVFLGNNLPKFSEHRAGCVTTELVTAFDSGIACYNVETQQFREFISTSDLQSRQESSMN